MLAVPFSFTFRFRKYGPGIAPSAALPYAVILKKMKGIKKDTFFFKGIFFLGKGIIMFP